MHPTRAWIIYTLVRLAAFAVPFAVLMLTLPTLSWNWLLGVGVGALVSQLVSYIFLRDVRVAMVQGMIERRERPDQRGADDLAEDAELDGTATAPRGTANAETR